MSWSGIKQQWPPKKGDSNQSTAQQNITNSAQNEPKINELNPHLYELRKKLQSRFLKEVDLSKIGPSPDIASVEMKEKIRGFLDRIITEEKLSIGAVDKSKLLRSLIDEIVGLGPLDQLLKDPMVTDVLVNGHRHVYVEKKRHAGTNTCKV